MQKDESLGDVTAHTKGNYKVILKKSKQEIFCATTERTVLLKYLKI